MSEAVSNLMGLNVNTGISMDAPKRTALVIYGSETGNSQDVAEDLARMVERLHFTTIVSEMDLVHIDDLLNYTIVIVAISTTGQGEFPRNARKLWRCLLRRSLSPGRLSRVSFTTFGLGDSSYPQFNWTSRKLHKRLQQLGAKEVYPQGEADEQHPEGIDGTFLSWAAGFQKHLLSSYPLPEGVTPISADVLLPPKYPLAILEDDTGSINHTGPSPPTQFPDNITEAIEVDSNMAEVTRQPLKVQVPPPPKAVEPSPFIPQLKDVLEGEEDPLDDVRDVPGKGMLPIPFTFTMQLVSNKRMTPKSHWQDVRELTFLIPQYMDYQPGAIITIFPKNFNEDVNKLIDLMDWNDVADLPLKFQAGAPDFLNDPLLVPKPRGLYNLKEDTTLRSLLIHNLDITAIPKRYFFEVISHFASEPLEKDRLIEFTNPAYTEEFFDYTTRPRRSIIEVLDDFRSVKIPLRWVGSIFPVIRGRQFSISSGGFKKESTEEGFIKLQILVAIVKYKTVLRKIRQGLCSRYIASLPPGSEINGLLDESPKFYDKVKVKPRLPVIFIAPGTGIAPVRSLVWERVAQRFDGLEVGECHLFFGGRNRAADYFYKEEWNSHVSRTTVHTAFSRDQKEKIYVQDIIRQEGKLIMKLLHEEAIIYVCGSSGAMPKAVREAFLDVLHENWPAVQSDRSAGEKYLDWLEKYGMWIEETW